VYGEQQEEAPMWPEWLEGWLTPCPGPYRALGYVRELFGIRRRHRRWRATWTPHCQRSRQLLLRAAARCPTRRRAVIFGSGWLYDVPLAELAARFREVVLVDVVHPRATRRAAAQRENVTLLQADITGTAEAVWRVAGHPDQPLPQAPAADLFVADPEVDLAASVNLLSQLPCMPEEYLLRRGVHSPEAVADYARAVVTAHLDYLGRLPGVVAVVADVESLVVEPAGKVRSRASTLWGVPFPWQGEEWTWPLVPVQPTYRVEGYHLRVVGVEDVKEAERRLSGQA
jgi:hypothetical protein